MSWENLSVEVAEIFARQTVPVILTRQFILDRHLTWIRTKPAPLRRHKSKLRTRAQRARWSIYWEKKLARLKGGRSKFRGSSK